MAARRWSPSRDDVIAVSCVLGITIIVFAASWWLMTLHVEPRLAKPTVNMSEPVIERTARDGLTVWDAAMVVDHVDPGDMPVEWETVRVTIRHSNGTVIFPTKALDRLVGGPDATSPIDVQVWYVPVPAGGGRTVAPGDGIRVTGMTADYEGALIQLSGRDADSQDVHIGSVTLPTDFP